MKKLLQILCFFLIGFTLNGQNCTIPTVWNGTSWSLGAPNLAVAAQIDAPYNATVANSFSTCNLIVNSTLTINNNAYIEVLNDITVDTNGILLVKSGGKLIPKSDTSIAYGVVTVERTTPPLKIYDYTYWSSPVNTQINTALLPTKWWMNYTFTFETQNFFDIQTQLGTTITPGSDGQDDNGDAWVIVNPNSNFITGKGYASMVLPSGTFPRTETVSFTGSLNTGIIHYPMMMSANMSSNDDDFNLVGNPYPASIFADDLILTNINNITGTLNFWSHAGTLSSAYPGLALLNFSPNDYAYYNLSGGLAASFGGKEPIGYIGSCQGFLVQAEVATNLEFKPSFMAPGYLNNTSTFFRTNEVQKKRAWLSIRTELGLFSQQLLNYTSNTTLGYDKAWDFKQPESRLAIKFYSIQDSQKYKIQARGEFNNQDIVKIGYFTAVAETFTINLDSIEGIENVYIRDNGVLYNLPYTFTSDAGEYNDRFEIVYTQSTLGVNPINGVNNLAFLPNPVKNILRVFTNKTDKVSIYDIVGKEIFLNFKVNDQETFVNVEGLANGIYLIKINEKTYKFIKKGS